MFSNSPDLKVVGKYPQLDKMFDGFNANRRHEAWGIIDYAQKKEPMKKTTGFKLRYHSKLTDWISFVHVGFGAALISERFYSLLQKFNCMDSICVDSEVEHRGKTYNYKFLFFPKRYDTFIDFSKSRFYIGFTNEWKSDITIRSYEEYIRKTNELEEIRKQTGGINHVLLLELYIDPLTADKDFFILPHLVRYFVSSRLKDAIDAHKISGIVFEPAQGYKKHVMDYTSNPPRQIT